ncbi:MAG TPA: hypothetical protein DD706_00320 [Nitrospiraceae bacterium]|nr:hypothetical protein [Nitrospiraceae bacterium]
MGTNLKSIENRTAGLLYFRKTRIPLGQASGKDLFYLADFIHSKTRGMSESFGTKAPLHERCRLGWEKERM